MYVSISCLNIIDVLFYSWKQDVYSEMYKILFLTYFMYAVRLYIVKNYDFVFR